MKLFFEGHLYPYRGIIDRFRSAFFFTDNYNGAISPYVGYFYSPEIGDSVFILPKIFITAKEDEQNNNCEKAFGKHDPEDVIEFGSDNEAIRKNGDGKFIFELTIRLYRALLRYRERTSGNTAESDLSGTNVLSRNGGESSTLLDIVISMIEFHKKHHNLFTYIAIINASGNNKINWNKTIRKVQPVIIDGSPFYTHVLNKNKTINYDEEIIILFYSSLAYIRNNYLFEISLPANYTLIPSDRIEAMIKNGKGTRLLKSIRRKYFSDELVGLWNLLYTFFDKSERISAGRYNDEYLLVRNFELVFEDMIDAIIGDDKLVRSKLKEQKDGKVIDHIYADKSLLDESKMIFFIGDSKYYKDIGTMGEEAVYKQFTYAKNIIQYNIDILNGSEKPELYNPERLRYRDSLTEGYNLTPNFFISASVDFSTHSYSEPQLELKRIRKRCNVETGILSFHYPNRLFDRDTLLLQSYSLNFLFVLSAYVACDRGEEFRSQTRKLFRDNICKEFDKRYIFRKITPKSENGSSQEDAVRIFIFKYFKLLNGKIYRLSDKSSQLILALEKRFGQENRMIMEEIAPDINIDEDDFKLYRDNGHEA